MRAKIATLFLFVFVFLSCTEVKSRRAEVLFYGQGVENVSNYASWMAIELFSLGINLTYTENIDDLNTKNLKNYDGLVLYVDGQDLSEEKEKVLKTFLKEGKGITLFNSTANSFNNSEWFRSFASSGLEDLGDGEEIVHIANIDDFEIENVNDFTVLNEKFSIQDIPNNINVTAYLKNRGEKEGGQIWTKNVDGGRIFYSAFGKNGSTWKNLSFLKLIAQGTQWTLGSNVKKLVDGLEIPNVSIYGDTISDFTARHDVPDIQEALSPEESMKLIQNPVDFELKLFASEPDITNPIAMSWDEKGRLWVIETVDYPNSFEEKTGVANDRIKICEDTDGDGVADKFTVFADGLNIATSLTFANDGVIVAMAPYMLFLKDTDGDDIADVRDTIMRGWSKGDTHAGPSNLQYGFDNYIYGVTGYAGFDGVIDGKRQVFSQGLYRFDSNGKDFEYLAHTNNNTWGLGFSEDNNIFISTANNTHSAYYSMPEKYLQRRNPNNDNHVGAVQKIDGHYEVHALTPNLRQVDVVGGFTSAAGHQLYTARDYPQSYWNRVGFVTEPTVRLVHSAIIEPDGAGFKEKDGWNLLASSDEWFGPVHAEVGPDGAVWVLDWYNFIIQHNVFVPAQAPSEKVLPFVDQPHGSGNAFDSDLRDKKHGRVYRVLYKGAKHKEHYKLSKSDPKTLIKALNSKNKFWRMHAQRLLVERGKSDIVKDLIKIINNEELDEIGINGPAIHAIWTLKGLNQMADKNVNEAVLKALKHPSAGVRKAAIQALGVDNVTFDKIVESGVFHDPDLNTRLAAFVTLAESQPSEQVPSLLAEAIKDKVNKEDRWLSAAIYAAIQTNESYFREKFKHEHSDEILLRLVESLNSEHYRLGRHARLQFSPNVIDKNITIEAEITRRNDDPYNGLIIGQGNRNNGYAVFMRGNTIFWEIYQEGKTHTISTSKEISNQFKFKAQLDNEKGMSLMINDKLINSDTSVSVFSKYLDLYLRSGFDYQDEYALTTYDNGVEFTGNVAGIDIWLTISEQDKHEEPEHANSETFISNEEGSQTIVIKAVKDIMQYDKKHLVLKSGSKVTLIFENPDGMPHNLLIIRPGTLEIVGKAADDMLRSATAADLHYVPQIKEVLYYTPLVNSGESATIEFDVPNEPGEYPFVCTFPGHWRGMNGIIEVK